jgi:hypothetical protein
MIKRWYGTGKIDATTGANYTYWFQDQTHTQPVPISAGLPGAGDTVYFDGGALGLDWNGNPVWRGVAIAPNQTFILGACDGENLTLDSTCTVGAGTTFAYAAGDYSSGYAIAANFLGDVHIVGAQSAGLDAGWRCNNGQAGGSIYVEATGGNNAHIYAPHASQVKSFKDVTINVCDGGYASLSSFTGITITGTMSVITLRGATYVAPSGKWVTLGSASAMANGIAVSPSLAGGGLLVI